MQVMIVDDHRLFREGLKHLLTDLNPDLSFIEADDCEQALNYSPLDIDLILLDLKMPGLSSMEALKAVKETFTAPIVVLSGEDDPQTIRDAIDHGAFGFIPKTSTAEILIAALQLILAGGTYIPLPAIQNMLPPMGKSNIRIPMTTDHPADSLSDRQHEVLLNVVQGKSNKAIAKELRISEGTVKAHLSAAFRALGVRNRTEAVLMVAQLGISLSELS